MFNGFDLPMPPDDSSWMEPDFILSYLVSSLVNMAGAPLGITLLVKGTILTGTLVSEREYLTVLSEMLQTQIRHSLSGLSDEERKIAESAFDLTELVEDFYPDLDADDDDDEEEDDNLLGMNPIFHLHLKDPVIISPQPAITFADGVFPIMRIRLANVDGWMMGTSIPGKMGPSFNSEIRH